MARRGRRALAPAALTLVALSAACRGPHASPSPAASRSLPSAVHETVPLPSVSATAPADAPSGLPPLSAPAAQLTLAVDGFRDAVVSVPLGARSARVVAFALHGNFDRPEWQCEVWRRITRGEVFVLCPRGIPRNDVPKELDRWEWGSVAKTKAELVAALAALRERFPGYVKPGPVVFTGFSLGAILGARLIQDPELDVGAAVLIEGGYQGWTVAKAKALKPRLQRLLFACGQTACRNAYRYQVEALFQRAELPSAMVADVKAGHTYDDPVAALVQQEWPALLVGMEHQ